MSKVSTTLQDLPRCTLCPAVCPLGVTMTGPDVWRTEFSLTDEGCLCPRGSAMGDLLGHPRRILSPRVRVSGRWRPASLAEALERVLAAAGEASVTILLDGNLPCEEITAAAAWCAGWKQARLCLVIEPSDEMLLLGTEASGAAYLSASQLAKCDGFLVIGGALAANPACARGLMDRRKAEPATPVVVIDPGAGVATKFATHRVDCPPGGELASLLAVAAAAKVDLGGLGRPPDSPSAAAGGAALARCKRVGVLIAAEYGRTASWAQIGMLAGSLAKALGGGVAVQTAGANALAAIRLAAALGAIPLAEALAESGGVRVAIGCDVLGMLGWVDGGVIQAAAAPLPNATTELADVVLPVALGVEMGGEYLADGGQRIRVSPALAPPVGIATPAGMVEALARQAGVVTRRASREAKVSARVRGGAEAVAPALAVGDPPPVALLLGRQAAHAGSGALTGYGSWQAATRGEVEVNLSAQDARQLGLKDRQPVSVWAGARSVRARVRLASELAGGTAVLSEGFAEARAALPSRIDDSGRWIVAGPVEFTISAEDVRSA